MENFLTQVMTSHGYLALIIFAFIEACCIPISSEITFAFAGVIAATHPDKFTVAAVIIIGTIAEMGGSLTSYAIGRRGGRHLLERYGRWVLISHSDLDRAERFFKSFSVAGIIIVVVLLAGLIAHRVHALRKDSHRRAAAESAVAPADPSLNPDPSGQPRIGTGNGNRPGQ